MSQSAEQSSRTVLTREEGYRFRVRFDVTGMPELLTDEMPPIGEGAGPNPSRLLATAVANCLAASLLFCLQKARVSVEGLEAEVTTELTRNEAGRLRIGGMQVKIHPQWNAEAAAKAQRCLDIFESFCVVTESVRHGVPVSVELLGIPSAKEGKGGQP